MKRGSWKAAGLALILVASAALSQTNTPVTDGQSDYIPGKSPYTGADTSLSRGSIYGPASLGHYDGGSVWKYLRVDANGNLMIVDQSPAYATWAQEVVYSDTMSNGLLGRNSDSTATAFDTANYHTLTFFFQTSCTGVPDSVMYLALSIDPCTIAASAALGDTSGIYHMEKVASRTTSYQGPISTARDTLGHPQAAMSTFGKEASAPGAGSLKASGGFEYVVAVRPDSAFRAFGPAYSPKGFALTIKDWYASHCRIRWRVLNAVVSDKRNLGYRQCQMVVTVEKSAL